MKHFNNTIKALFVVSVISILFVLWSCSETTDNIHEEQYFSEIEEVISDTSPGYEGKIAYDAARSRMVFVNEALQTWEWEEVRWRKKWISGPLTTFVWFEICYFPEIQKLVLLGLKNDGYGSEGPFPIEQWHYDGETWQQIHPDQRPPLPGGIMVYDSVQKRLLYTACITSYFYTFMTDANDFNVWSFDGGSWSEVPVEAELDILLEEKSLGFDPKRNKLILSGYSYYYDRGTWEFDGRDWIKTNSAGSGGSLIYDETTKMLYLLRSYSMYGYHTSVYRYEEDGEWTMINFTEGFSAVSTAAYHEIEKTIYTYAVPVTMTYSPEMSWSIKSKQDVPGNSDSTVAAYYPEMESVVILTSLEEWSNRVDTWFWNGTSFLKSDAEMEERDLDYASLVYDPVQKRLLLYCIGIYGHNLEVFAFQGSEWINLNTPFKFPDNLDFIQTCYHDDLQGVIAIGGEWGYLDVPEAQTWLFKDNTWTSLATENAAPGLYKSNLAYDPDNDRIVLFGGNTSLCFNETWELKKDETVWNWHRIETEHAPGFRSGGVMYYDPLVSGIVLCGGGCGADRYADLWLFKDNDWRQLDYAGVKPKRYMAAFAYDMARSCGVIWGGRSAAMKHGSLLEVTISSEK